MNCPKCNRKLFTVDTRKDGDSVIKRRRKCKVCELSYDTTETLDIDRQQQFLYSVTDRGVKKLRIIKITDEHYKVGDGVNVSLIKRPLKKGEYFSSAETAYAKALSSINESVGILQNFIGNIIKGSS